MRAAVQHSAGTRAERRMVCVCRSSINSVCREVQDMYVRGILTLRDNEQRDHSQKLRQV
jgi:hypothetical protein